MTNQEMFDLAVRGLASQDWHQCRDNDGSCTYTDDWDRHCAFGWVDPGIPREFWSGYSIKMLANLDIGVAATLDSPGMQFAMDIQQLHDTANRGLNWTRAQDMFRQFDQFCDRHGLTWPADVPRVQPS